MGLDTIMARPFVVGDDTVIVLNLNAFAAQHRLGEMDIDELWWTLWMGEGA